MGEAGSTREGVRVSSFSLPKLPPETKEGTTVIAIQRHGEKDTEGYLLPEEPEEVARLVSGQFSSLIAELPIELRDKLAVGVFASDADRCLETAKAVLAGVQEVFERDGIDGSATIISKGVPGNPFVKPMAGLRETAIRPENVEYIAWLHNKYGYGLNYWIAFENDTEENMRVKLGADGPWELADRLDRQKILLDRYAKDWHKANPGKVLILWAVTHYDLISPWLKKYQFEMKKTDLVLVDYRAGFSEIHNPDGAKKLFVTQKKLSSL